MADAAADELKIEARDGGSQFTVRATPRARRNALEGVRNGALLVSVTAVPEDGAANAAIMALLAKSLRVPKSALELRRGMAARDKAFWLLLPPDALRERLNALDLCAK
jgi:uncharacterized protein YggU (UPF0235/DUF167 family)